MSRIKAVAIGLVLLAGASGIGMAPRYCPPAAPIAPEDEITQPQIHEPLDFTQEELAMVAKLVYGEARGCSDRHQQLVAAVVYNRVRDERFPNNIRDVICQKGQYTPVYAYDLPDEATAGEEMQRCFLNARAALEGRVECPEDVIFQAEFRQGFEVYEAIESHIYTVTYFCRG